MYAWICRARWCINRLVPINVRLTLQGQVEQLQTSLKAVREMSQAHQHAHEDLQTRLRSVKAEQSQLQLKLRQRELDLDTQTSLVQERDHEIHTNRGQHLQAQKDWLVCPPPPPPPPSSSLSSLVLPNPTL